MTDTASNNRVPNRVCWLARIDIPIIQAPMTYIAGAQLAAAVSNAGALGIIETTSEQGRADLKRVRDLTDGSVGANIALLFNRNPAVVDLLAANDIRFVTTSAGDPKLMIDRLHDAGITVFHVVGTLAAARKAVDAGVDGLVVEGVEGGGFKNRFGAATMVLLPLVAAHVDVPIVAAGGICDARSMAAALVLGAEGVQMGTRLLASADSPVHGNLKQAVVGADETSTVMLPLDGKRMMRVIRTAAATRSRKDQCLSVFGGERRGARARAAALFRRGHGRQRRQHGSGGRPHRRPPAGGRHHQGDVDRMPRGAGRHRRPLPRLDRSELGLSSDGS